MDNFDLKKYLAEGRLYENVLAQKLRDEAKHPDSKVGAAILNKYAEKVEKAKKEDYVKLLKDMESELISKHPDTFSGEDDIPGSFLSGDKLNEAIKLIRPSDNIAILKGDSGEYDGFIEDGEVSFSTTYDDLDYRITDYYDESNIEDFLGRGHAFVELAKKYDYDWNIEPDLVGITIKLKDKLSESINLSDYNEDVEKAIDVGIRVGSNFDVEDVMYYVHNNWMGGNLSAEEAMRKISKYLDPR